LHPAAAFGRFAYRDEPADKSATVAQHEVNLFDESSERQEHLVHLSALGDKWRASLLFGLCETAPFHVVARFLCHQRRNVRRATFDGIRPHRQGQLHRQRTLDVRAGTCPRDGASRLRR
jgi:hypothetical protein